MYGMNVTTGKRLTGIDHLKQSIKDIITTPIGSRVMRRNYGSHMFDLIDQAGNDAGRMRIIAANADAITRWEPRVKVNRISVGVAFDGRVSIDLEGESAAGDFDTSVTLGARV